MSCFLCGGRGGSFAVCPGLEGGNTVSDHAQTIDDLIRRLQSGTKSQISSTHQGVTITGTRDKETGDIVIRVHGLK